MARQLGIPRYTMRDICQRDSNLAFKRNGIYYIRLAELAKRPGFDLVGALLAPHSKWIKAVVLARISGIPERTMRSWCATRPNFAKRLGSMWYVDLALLGANDDQIATLLGEIGKQKIRKG